MKKILLLYGLLILVLIVLASVKSGKFDSLIRKKADMQVEGTKFSLLVAKSEEERMIGLTGRSSLDSGEGMLFVFPKKGIYSSWTRKMKFPIDIIYIRDGTVTEIFHNVPSSQENQSPTIIKSANSADYVVELSAGSVEKFGIKAGDKVSFQNL